MRITAFILISITSFVLTAPASAQVCIGKWCWKEDAKKQAKPSAKPAAQTPEKKQVATRPATKRKHAKSTARSNKPHVVIWKARQTKQPAAPFVASYQSAAQNLQKNLSHVRYTGDADMDYASAMLPHQQAALELAKAQLIFGKDHELKDLAMRTLIWQDANHGKMKQWLSVRSSSWQASNVNETPSVQAYKAATKEIEDAMKQPYTGNADQDFARMLVPHHQSTVAISEVMREYGADKDMRAMASDIIRDQSQEIRQIKNWINNNSK